MSGNDFLDKMELIDPDYVKAADEKPLKKHLWIRWSSIAACLCLFLGGTMLFLNMQRTNIKTPVLTWDTSFQPADYFRYNNKAANDTSVDSADTGAVEYSDERYFSGKRNDMESSNIIPTLDNHPVFDCIARYKNDNSIYSITFSWNERGENYSSLRIITGPKEVKQIQDCIYVEIDNDGNIISPAITVTERDGIQIVAQGNEGGDKTITFQSSAGWYQITGSGYDSHESMVNLLDWLWENPINYNYFGIENGSEIISTTINEHPEIFSKELPSFENYGYLLGKNNLQLKDGIPFTYQGHYFNGVSQELIDNGEYLFENGWNEIHWCIMAEPNYYDLQQSLGELSSLSEAQVKNALNTNGKICFLHNGILIKIYSSDSETVWNMLTDLKA